MTITTKYKVDDVLIFYKNGEMLFDKVRMMKVEIYGDHCLIQYLLGGEWFPQSQVGNTKQELIDNMRDIQPKEFNEPPF